jgi:hypothetical protein
MCSIHLYLMSQLISSHLISSHLISSHLISSHLISSHLMLIIFLRMNETFFLPHHKWQCQCSNHLHRNRDKDQRIDRLRHNDTCYHKFWVVDPKNTLRWDRKLGKSRSIESRGHSQNHRNRWNTLQWNLFLKTIRKNMKRREEKVKEKSLTCRRGKRDYTECHARKYHHIHQHCIHQ